MQSVPDGYEALDFVGFTDRGEFSGTETYIENDIVHWNNTAWRCLKDNTTGITPAEGENWTVFIASETDSSGITTTDTEGLVGSAGEKVSNQDLIDAIADRVINRLLSKSAISTTQINDQEKVPSSALVFGMAEEIGELNENFTNNHYKIHENERPFVDVALQRYAVKKSGYYLIVTNVRVFGATQGTFPCPVDSYDIDNINIFDNDPVSSQTYKSEYSWATLVSVEKMTKGTHNKYFRVPNVHVENFDTRTTLYWLGN